uniref:Apple domain-containing protein n=1 Tax=Tetranychus urticae TaxID=32264 RepID=T1L6E4_TETUR
MMSATSEINERLKITYYYKHNSDDETGIKNPKRIEINGYDSSPFASKENIILDIYVQNENTVDQLQNQVQPLPGIGCPHYLSGNKDLPALRIYHLHYTMQENIQGSTTSQSYSEIHAAQFYNYLSLKTTLLGATTETINDYRFGVSFPIDSDGIYVATTIDTNAPGVNMHASFTLTSLFMLDGSFKYLGKLNLMVKDSLGITLGCVQYEHRSGVPVEVWESVQFNVNINGKKVDKAVITQYFAQSQHEDIFWDYSLVSTKISIYDYDQSKKVYTWKDGITRDYMNFQEVRSVESIRSLTEKVKYSNSDGKLILDFILECDDFDPAYGSCIKHTENRVNWLKGDFLYYVLLARPASILRISDIQYRFTDTKVEMEVTFVNLPQYNFNSKFMSVSQETLAKMKKTKADSEDECVRKLSSYQETIKWNISDIRLENFIKFWKGTKTCSESSNLQKFQHSESNLYEIIVIEMTSASLRLISVNSGRTPKFQPPNRVIIYIASNLVCGYLNNLEDLKEDLKLGEASSVFQFPLNNFHRIKQELPLDQIHDAYLQDVGQTYELFDGDMPVTFKIIGVIDVTKEGTAPYDDIASQLRWDAKLKIDDQFTLSVPDVKTFADCYRNCHDSDQVSCITFSFCNTGGVTECRVSSLQSSDIINRDLHTENDIQCTIFSISILNDYSKALNRKFKTQLSTVMQTDQHFCAESCHPSSECISFQYCDGSCSFGGLFTDADTQYDEECTIYFPKAAEKYQKTGNKIVSDVISTENKLTLDQCASLCLRWSDGDTRFKNPDTKTSDGGQCSNYELKVESSGKKQKESSSTEVVKGTTGSGAFGIIMLFLFVGAALGSITPFAFAKVKQMREASKINIDFTWKRQIDEQIGDIH